MSENKNISIFFITQFPDIVSYHNMINVETYVLPVIVDSKFDDNWKLELSEKIDILFDKLSYSKEDKLYVQQKFNDISDIFNDEMEESLMYLNIFNQRKQYRIDIDTENGKFCFIVKISKKLSFFDYLGYKLF